ncbi:hypothetical protein [Microbacterium sp.]|uniref:hypothetical protein n=1 Tax=Microbacterium sp. TaxID=51671 RepID=UPI00333E99CD
MSAVAVEAPPLPVHAGPLGLLSFAVRERRTRRPIQQVREIMDDNPTGLSIDELGVILFTAYIIPEPGGASRPPLVLIERDKWAHWFWSVGFLTCGFRTTNGRPRQPMTLYRASTEEHSRTGLSWTPGRRWASEYADLRARELRQAGDGASVHVYAAEIQPSWLLGMNAAVAGLSGNEYIVDLPEHAEVRCLTGEPTC